MYKMTLPPQNTEQSLTADWVNRRRNGTVQDALLPEPSIFKDLNIVATAVLPVTLFIEDRERGVSFTERKVNCWQSRQKKVLLVAKLQMLQWIKTSIIPTDRKIPS